MCEPERQHNSGNQVSSVRVESFVVLRRIEGVVRVDFGSSVRREGNLTWGDADSLDCGKVASDLHIASLDSTGRLTNDQAGVGVRRWASYFEGGA